MTTADDGATRDRCCALKDGSKEGVGGQVPAPHGDDAWGQEAALRLDRVERDGDSDRGQSHLRTFQWGEGVFEARRPRPCRPTCSSSGSDGGDRRHSGRRRRTRRRRGSGSCSAAVSSRVATLVRHGTVLTVIIRLGRHGRDGHIVIAPVVMTERRPESKVRATGAVVGTTSACQSKWGPSTMGVRAT